MTTASMDYLHNLARRRATPLLPSRSQARHLRQFVLKLTLIFLSVLLLCGSIAAYGIGTSLLGANPGPGNTCNWYTVEAGDTLTTIAQLSHTTISTLVHVNTIQDANLIFVNQRLCIPSHLKRSGIAHNGEVRWFDYRDLDWSDRTQVHSMLYQVATLHHLPPRLLLAIAWQESGWTQHIIAGDGGIGVMQLMPYTAASINVAANRQLDPYQLWDNLNLGALYLQSLWRTFHGNLVKVISAYNEGGWAVVHVGIFNWHYVQNVLALMDRLN